MEMLKLCKKEKKNYMHRLCMQHHTGDTTEMQKKLKNSQTSSAIYIKYSCVLKKPKWNFELSC